MSWMVLLRKVSSALVQHSFWAYATSPSVYVARTCNDLNFQPNGAPWATGSGPSCYANQPTGKIYDMSGNVAEWTSTPVVVGGQTQYQARGGNYSSDTGGTACDATPVLQSPL